MRFSDEYKTGSNSSAFKIAEKRYRSNNSIISCCYCGYNRIENRTSKLSRTWKRFRKEQYKEVMYSR